MTTGARNQTGVTIMATNGARGLRPIGDLTKPGWSSLDRTGSTVQSLKRPSPSSATTGPTLAGKLALNSLGAELGAIVSASLRGDERTDPEQIDVALDSLPVCVAQCLKITRTKRVDPKHGFDGMSADYAPLCRPSDLAWSEVENFLAALDALCAPAPKEKNVFEIGRMRVMTKSRAEDEETTEFILRCFAEDVAAYPADVMRAACRRWCARETFFPSWAELKADLDRLARKRYRLRAAVARTLELPR